MKHPLSSIFYLIQCGNVFPMQIVGLAFDVGWQPQEVRCN